MSRDAVKNRVMHPCCGGGGGGRKERPRAPSQVTGEWHSLTRWYQHAHFQVSLSSYYTVLQGIGEACHKSICPKAKSTNTNKARENSKQNKPNIQLISSRRPCVIEHASAPVVVFTFILSSVFVNQCLFSFDTLTARATRRIGKHTRNSQRRENATHAASSLSASV